MKKTLKLTLAVVLMLGSTSLFAQKFGRINSQEIIMAMPETKTMQTNMETFGKELQDNIETMNVEFNTTFQEYQNKLNTSTDSIREMKEKELIQKAKEAIDKVSAAGGYLFVFDTSAGSLAYFDEVQLTDIAPEVKKELGITEEAAAAATAAAGTK